MPWICHKTLNKLLHDFPKPNKYYGKFLSNNINDIEVIVNSDLSKIYNWSKEWLVDFNPKKTECIIFSTNQVANKPCIVFNNENVKFVENHKHLGVTFSHNCKWHCHIENILKSIYIIRRI
jgi:hypothetical protein